MINSSAMLVAMMRNAKSLVRGRNRIVYLGARTTSSYPVDWNRVVSNAERVVGYSTSYLSLRCLLSDEISNLAADVRKLVGTGHPLLKTAKRLLYNGKNYMQTKGLVVLLLSKSAGHKTQSNFNDPVTNGISHNQRTLAEVTEMIHMAQQIHKGVVNVSTLLFPDSNSLQDMEFGNKIAVLCGDYLLASASKSLASLKNPDVVRLISKATCDFSQGEFIGNHDASGNAFCTPNTKFAEWEMKTYLTAGSLLAMSCKSALILADHTQDFQDKGFSFGKNLALAWQVYSDMQPFIDPRKHPPGMPYDLMSLPVLIHLQDDKDLFKYIENHTENLDSVDYKLVRDVILSGQGVEKANELCKQYANNAIDVLDSFDNMEAILALKNISNILKNVNIHCT